MATNLDDLTRLHDLDPSGMMALTVGFPEQCEGGIEIGEGFAVPAGWPTGPGAFHHIVVTGLGGSVAGGDFLRSLAESSAPAPIVVNRDDALPAFVGPDSLVIAVSYSGDTEETLAAYDQAKAAAAKILVLTSGGSLLAKAQADGNPALVVSGSQPQRASSGYAFFPVWLALQKLGVLSDRTIETNEAIALMKRQRDAFKPEAPLASNPAKQLARALNGKLPVVYGSHGYCNAIAYHWHTQFNRNAKVHCFAGAFPEMSHNEILGWINAPRQAPNWVVVMIRDRRDSARVKARVDIAKQLIGSDIPIHDIYADGDSDLARLWTGVYFGDFVSVYLALAWGEDPAAAPSVDKLEEEMAKVG